MSEYFSEKAEEISLGKFCTATDIVDVIMQITDCYNLGMKVLTYNYGEEADKLYNENNSMIWLSSDYKDKNYLKWKKLTKQAENDRQEDINKLFSMLAKHINNWWV